MRLQKPEKKESMKIVLDTNVLISGILSPGGNPSSILNLIINKRLILLADTRILTEYEEVLKRPKFQFRSEWIKSLMDFIRNECELIIPDPSDTMFLDPDDRMFWEVAWTGKALYIVTGNKRHFPEDPIVVTPAEFLNIYFSSR